MIGAADALAADHASPRRAPRKLGAAELGTAVPAYVVEGAQRSGLVSNQQDTLAQDVEHGRIAGIGQIAVAPDADPLAEKDPLPLAREYLGRPVIIGRQRLFQGSRRNRGCLGFAHRWVPFKGGR